MNHRFPLFPVRPSCAIGCGLLILLTVGGTPHPLAAEQAAGEQVVNSAEEHPAISFRN